MRNPIRVKNLRPRYLPWYAAGAVVVALADVAWRDFWSGLPLVAAGLALRAWGTGHLIKNDRFTVSGPYSFVRHPLYLGTALVASGFAVMLGGWVGLAVWASFVAWFAFSYFPRKEQVEAERLAMRYGAAFERYRAEVPALWPRWSPWRPEPALAEKLEIDLAWRFACYDENNELGTDLAVLAAVTGLAACAAWL